jgi:hypothetical protein
MNWWTIIKRPDISMPEIDKYFEWNPDFLEKTVKDWDKDNPAKVLSIEPPQSPDPAERMEDGSIRFAPKGSKKFIQDSFKFITDRAIDNQSGLLNILREKGYKVTVKDSSWIKSHYGNKLNRISVPEEAKAYLITVGSKIAESMRKKNPKRSARFPDKKRSAENVELWNKEHKEFKLDTLEGFQDRIEEVGRTEGDVMRYIQENPSFIKNKHDLYLTQRAFLNRNWVWQNIERPIYKKIVREDDERKRIDDEKRAEISGRIEQTDDRQREFSRRGIPRNTKRNKDRQSGGKIDVNQFRQNRRKKQ